MGIGPSMAVAEYHQELWDDPGKANNHWSYYDTDAPEPHDVDMDWHASGGVGSSGYVSTPLDHLDPAHHPQAFWPAYLYRGLGENQEIDLGIANAAIKVYASDVSTTGITPLNLQGGSLYFFIGQYLAGIPDDPADDKWSFFYHTMPVTINQGDWEAESTLTVGDDANWGVIADTDPDVSPSDLFYHPQQWGFCVFEAEAAPSGVLAVDSFQIVPEPSVLVFLGMGIVGCAVCAYVCRRRT
jgi:hypothetical protein